MSRWQQARWIDAMSRIDLELINGEFPDQDLQAEGAAKEEISETKKKTVRRKAGIWVAAVSGIAAASVAFTTFAVVAGRKMRQPA